MYIYYGEKAGLLVRNNWKKASARVYSTTGESDAMVYTTIRMTRECTSWFFFKTFIAIISQIRSHDFFYCIIPASLLACVTEF